MYICMYVSQHIPIYTCIWLYVYMYVYMSVWIYIIYTSVHVYTYMIVNGDHGSDKLNKFHKESESHSVMSDSLWPHGLYSPWNSPGQNTGVGSLSLPQRIFPTQESNQGLLHFRQILYQLSYQGSHKQLTIMIKEMTDMGFPGGSVLKNLPANSGKAGDASSIPGSRRSPGEGSGNALQYSCLENSMDRRAWWDTVTRGDWGHKELTRLRNWAHIQSKWINLSVIFLNSRHPLKVCLLVLSIGPQSFWHQGPVSWKTLFPLRGGWRWFQDDSSAFHLLCTLLLLSHQLYLRS